MDTVQQTSTNEENVRSAMHPFQFSKTRKLRDMLSGLSMLDKIDISQLQKVTSEDDLQSAFTRREAMVSALKQEKSKDWEPEYVPKSIVRPSFKKGDVLRKTARVSAAMILQVKSGLL